MLCGMTVEVTGVRWCQDVVPGLTGMRKLQVLGLVYFSYLFLFSGLEFTLSFLTHQRFHFTR